MIQLRRSKDRGFFDHGWLKTHHTFSFGEYYDTKFMGLRNLRVINEDYVDPGQGFSTHAHRDMEIITYIVNGELEHKDSMGNGSRIRVGEAQYMSAGKGVTHSEFNPDSSSPVHLLQIWIHPNQVGLTPRYNQKKFPLDERKGRLQLLVSGNGQDGSIEIHQDSKIFASILNPNQVVEHLFVKGRAGYLQAIRGELRVQDQPLSAGDGAFIENETRIQILGVGQESEFLLFDLN